MPISKPEATSIWLRRPLPATRSSPLSRIRIVEAAVDLLDRRGISGLTMRSLAEALDVTATALYWHVNTKDDVLDLAFDHIFGEVALPEPTEWQHDVRYLMKAWRAVLLRHPWAPAWIGRPVLGPNVLARTEFLQSALSRGGLTDLHLAVTTRLLANHVIGSALTEATFRRTSDPGLRLDARRHITADPTAFPTLNASGHLDANRWNDDELFEHGLDAILATTQTRHAAAPHPKTSSRATH